MSLMGIGSAQVDLIINKNIYRQAEMVKGRFKLMGGTVQQQIKRVECDLVKMNLISDSEEVIGSVTFLSDLQIDTGEQSHLDFEYQLPEMIENTSHTVSYHFKTKLIFDEGVKSLDHDPIFIVD
jgi:sporulation-control protein